jgi:tetratricopeptide (TPR) repeat protein
MSVRIALFFTYLLIFAAPLAAQSKGQSADTAPGWGDYWTGADRAPSGYPKLRNDFSEAMKSGSFAKALAFAEKMVANYQGYPGPYYYRGLAKRGLRQYDGARADFEKGLALAKQAKSADAIGFGTEQMAVISLLQGRTAEAQSDFRQAERQSTELFGLYNNYAWILATAPSPAIRNGPEAVRLATKACELKNWKDSSCLDTLAAACAEKGDFASAVKWQSKAIELGSTSKSTLAGMNTRLALYRKNQPYHATK